MAQIEKKCQADFLKPKIVQLKTIVKLIDNTKIK
jgi:hypothetical protein